MTAAGARRFSPFATKSPTGSGNYGDSGRRGHIAEPGNSGVGPTSQSDSSARGDVRDRAEQNRKRSVFQRERADFHRKHSVRSRGTAFGASLPGHRFRSIAFGASLPGPGTAHGDNPRTTLKSAPFAVLFRSPTRLRVLQRASPPRGCIPHFCQGCTSSNAPGTPSTGPCQTLLPYVVR